MRSGKAPVSCIPCAKRKVRCDKQYPCCHCKRRPQDTCAYPSPNSEPEGRAEQLEERVVQLVRVIRSLGGDPSDSPQFGPEQTPVSLPPDEPTTKHRASQDASTGHPSPFDRAGLLAHDEEATYVETPMWYSWHETKSSHDQTTGVSSRRQQNATASSSSSGYIATILDPFELQDKTFPTTWRHPAAHLGTLWEIFLQNVHPLIKIFFDWEIGQIVDRAKRVDAELSGPEATLVAAIKLLAAVSVPEDGSQDVLHGEKAAVVEHLQQATEVSLRMVGYAVTSNKLTFQAFMLYLQAIRSRAHPAAMFSLMGVATRIAERMGLHRDGEILGLSVLRSEERRRMWWQLQYMELTVANQVGTLSPSVLGKWDSNMPANIDDDELGPGTKTLPPQRATLTSMSNCLWKYTVLQFHRDLRSSAPAIPSFGETTSMIDKIEEMLRVKFVQHCELLNPLHVNLHLGICQVLVATRRLMCQPAFVNAKISDMSRQQRDELLEIGMKNLDYCILIQTSEPLKGFKWHNNAFFPWAAFIYVILEANHRSEDAEVKNIWRTISRTYETHEELRTADHRQDATFAARITASGWQKYQSHLQKQDHERREDTNPKWITEVCQTFNLPHAASGALVDGTQQYPPTATDIGAEFELDLDMIDWSAWDGAYMDSAMFGGPG